MFSLAHRSASQYQVNMHSTATTKSSLKACTADRNVFGFAVDVARQQHRSSTIQHAQVHLSSVQVDTAVVLVLPGIESHQRPPFRLVSDDTLRMVSVTYQARRKRGPRISINRLQRTALRAAAEPGRFKEPPMAYSGFVTLGTQ
jgi:hypothetical protein